MIGIMKYLCLITIETPIFLILILDDDNDDCDEDDQNNFVNCCMPMVLSLLLSGDVCP